MAFLSYNGRTIPFIDFSNQGHNPEHIPHSHFGHSIPGHRHMHACPECEESGATSADHGHHGDEYPSWLYNEGKEDRLKKTEMMKKLAVTANKRSQHRLLGADGHDGKAHAQHKSTWWGDDWPYFVPKAPRKLDDSSEEHQDKNVLWNTPPKPDHIKHHLHRGSWMIVAPVKAKLDDSSSQDPQPEPNHEHQLHRGSWYLKKTSGGGLESTIQPDTDPGFKVDLRSNTDKETDSLKDPLQGAASPAIPKYPGEDELLNNNELGIGPSGLVDIPVTPFEFRPEPAEPLVDAAKATAAPLTVPPIDPTSTSKPLSTVPMKKEYVLVRNVFPRTKSVKWSKSKAAKLGSSSEERPGQMKTDGIFHKKDSSRSSTFQGQGSSRSMWMYDKTSPQRKNDRFLGSNWLSSEDANTLKRT